MIEVTKIINWINNTGSIPFKIIYSFNKNERYQETQQGLSQKHIIQGYAVYGHNTNTLHLNSQINLQFYESQDLPHFIYMDLQLYRHNQQCFPHFYFQINLQKLIKQKLQFISFDQHSKVIEIKYNHNIYHKNIYNKLQSKKIYDFCIFQQNYKHSHKQTQSIDCKQKEKNILNLTSSDKESQEMSTYVNTPHIFQSKQLLNNQNQFNYKLIKSKSNSLLSLVQIMREKIQKKTNNKSNHKYQNKILDIRHLRVSSQDLSLNKIQNQNNSIQSNIQSQNSELNIIKSTGYKRMYN